MLEVCTKAQNSKYGPLANRLDCNAGGGFFANVSREFWDEGAASLVEGGGPFEVAVVVEHMLDLGWGDAGEGEWRDGVFWEKFDRGGFEAQFRGAVGEQRGGGQVEMKVAGSRS